LIKIGLKNHHLLSPLPANLYGDVSIINWGAFAPDSRLARLKAVALVVVRAILKVPFPVRSGVTSAVVQVPPEKEPEVAMAPSKAGALE
jgi:hypothetical protein